MPSMPHLRPGGGRLPARGARADLPRIPVPVARAVVDCAVYVDGIRVTPSMSYIDALAHVRESGEGFVWLGMHEPDEQQMQAVAEVFGLHELAVEDAVTAHQRPKLERYDDMYFMVLRTISYIEHESIESAKDVVASGEIMVFTGPDFVITVRHGDHTQLSGLRRSLETRSDRLALGPTAVLHAIADLVVDSYLEVTEQMDFDVVAIEESVFGTGAAFTIDPVYLLKREVLELRRAVTPLSAPLATLMADNVAVPKEIRRRLRDVADHLATVIERVIEFDEVLTSLLGAAAAKVGIRQNTDMRKISAWVAIGAVPTMVAGIYGMNFTHMPELQETWGYPAVLLFLLATCVALFTVFRRNNWL